MVVISRNRGSHHNTDPVIRSGFHDKCLHTISKKFNEPEIQYIKTDCDAISVLITTTNLTDGMKKSLLSFFYLFGSEITLRCGLPLNVVGSSKKDGIFSCASNRGGDKCQHLPPQLQGCEMIIIDTPIKIACHKSCKERIIKFVMKRGSVLLPSSQPGLCFDSKKASNKPSFQLIVEAIVDSCYVPEIGMHIIHIADMGMRMPITVNNNDCPLSQIFEVIAKMRSDELVVDIIQLDIAYNVPVGKNQLIHISCEKGKEKTRESIMAKSEQHLYPLHQLSKDSEGKISTQKQKGSVILKKSEWNTPNILDMKDIQSEQSMREIKPNSGIEYLLKLYSSESGTEITLKIDSNCVYSMKIYSTISHYIMQQRSKFPLQQSDMFNIGSCSMIQLQRLIKNLDSMNKGVFEYVKDYGIYIRVEVSIRPTHTEKFLRQAGHYNDFMAHVYMAISDVMQEAYYSVTSHYVHPQPVQAIGQTMIGQISPYLRCRSSSKFNECYSNSRTTDWLKAHITMIMISMGIGTSYHVKYICLWLADKDRYDPHDLYGILFGNTHRIVRTSEHNPLTKKSLSDLSNVLRVHFSKRGRIILFEYINNKAFTKNIIKWYERLLHKDKITMASQLFFQIIPQLSLLMSKQRSSNPINRDVIDNSVDDDEEIICGYPWFEKINFIDIGIENENEYDVPTLPHVRGESLPRDPISRIIILILQFGIFSDPRRPMFLRKLSKYILLCHSLKVILPGHSCSLEPLDGCKSTKAYELLHQCSVDSNYQASNITLQTICNKLNIPVSGTNQKNETYIKSMCLFYLFPCSGVTFGNAKLRNKFSSKIMNTIINELNIWDIVYEVKCTSRIKHRFLRNTDNQAITITDKSSLVFSNRTIPSLHNTNTGSLTGYQILCSCLNVDMTNTNKLRKTLQTHVTHLDTPSHSFLSDMGTINPNFDGCDSVGKIEEKNGMLFLLSTPSVASLKKYLTFKPNIILPIVSLVYKMTIFFANYVTGKSYLYVCHGDKSITYFFDTTNISPMVTCGAVISYHSIEGEEMYSSHITHLSPSQTPRYRNVTHVSDRPRGMFCGRKSSSTNSKHSKLETPRIYAKQCLIVTLEKLLNKIFNMTIGSESLLGLPEYCDDLFFDETNGNLDFFDADTIVNAPNLSMPMKSIALYLRSTDPSKMTHHTLCPLLCLKLKISLGIFEISRGRGKTHFYGFDSTSNKVVHAVFPKYCVLIDRSNIIYVHTSSASTGYNPPTMIHHQHNGLKQRYSHIDSHTMTQAANMLTNSLNARIYLGASNLEDYAVLCNNTASSMILTQVTVAKRNNCSVQQTMCQGLTMYMIIIVFPTFIENTQQWEVCVVHHPIQKADAEDEFSSVFRRLCLKYPNIATELNKFPTTYMNTMSTSEGEFGFYIILYIYIGHHCRTLSEFKIAVQSLVTETNLTSKMKNVVRTNLLKRSLAPLIIPMWLEQIVKKN